MRLILFVVSTALASVSREKRATQCPSGQHFDSDSNSCLENECWCANGIAAGSEVNTGICLEHDTQQCFSCNNDFELTDDNTCQYICNNFFHPEFNLIQQRWTCAANKCTCANGSPKESKACVENGLNACDSCNDGYKIDSFNNNDRKTCVARVCPCDNGTGFGKQNAGECRNQEEVEWQNCQYCDIGYELDNSHETKVFELSNNRGQFSYKPVTCTAVGCDCSNGTPATYETNQMCIHSINHDAENQGWEICQSCDQYYHLEEENCDQCALNPVGTEGLCVANICYCEKGTPRGLGECNNYVEAAPHSHECSSCDHEWLKVDEDPTSVTQWQCVYKECGCTNGLPRLEEECIYEAPREMCRDCNKYFHLEEKDILIIDDVNKLNYTITTYPCVGNVCTCLNGLRVNSAECTTQGANECQECNVYYHPVIDSDNIMSCEANTCFCNNGTAKGIGACVANNGHECASCDPGYHLEGNLCVENVCECLNGEPLDGAICENHGGIVACGSCAEFYNLGPDGTCLINTCFCDNGETFPPGECPEPGKHCCKKCDDFYTAVDEDNDGYPVCVKNICTCPDGEPVDDCDEMGKVECKSCKDAWKKLENGSCTQKECMCINGTPLTGEDCTDESTDMCFDCDPFFHKDEITGQCVKNVCICSNGLPVDDCTEDGAEECATCNGSSFLYNDDGVCKYKTCVCENGTPFEEGDCRELGGNWCSACDDYFHLVDDQCVPNECFCTGGDSVPSNQCLEDGTERCLNCNLPGFSVDSDTGNCRENECECRWYNKNLKGNFAYQILKGSVGTTGSDCPVDGGYGCSSCGAAPSLGQYYHVNDYNETLPSYGLCIPNECYCTEDGILKEDGGVVNGIPKTINNCKAPNGWECDSCFNGLVLDLDLHCVNAICNCPNGAGDRSGLCNGGRDYTSCSECDLGYHFEAYNLTLIDTNEIVVKETCELNQCICENGESVTGEDCTVHGAIECLRCDFGYYLNGNVCEPNLCECENGVGKSGADCSLAGREECESCDSGYLLTGQNVCRNCQEIFGNDFRLLDEDVDSMG